MTPAFKRASAAPGLLLREHLLAVTYRGDSRYLRQPGAGVFAVLDIYRARKTFFAVPHRATQEALRTLIEDYFDAPVERVGEFLWAVECETHPCFSGLPKDIAA